MTSLAYRSFAGGIIGQQLYGRADQTKYQTGLKEALNVIVERSGAATNRPGSRFIGAARYGDTYPIRLIEFVYNNDQTYILEFGHFYMRVYRYGGAVVPAASTWSNATSYAFGDMASLAGVTYYCILAHTNHTPPNGTYWFAMTAGYYEIPTIFDSSDLFEIQFNQSLDVVTLVHPDYPPQELRRTAHTAWTISNKVFGPSVSRPTSCSGVAGGAGTASYRYQITAFDRDTLEESYAGRETAKTITGATQANPCAITAVAHGYSTGDEVFISGIVGMTQINNRTFVITKTGADTFTLDGENSTAHTAYSSGGSAARLYVRLDSAAAPTGTAPHVLTWNSVGAGFGYWIYRYKDGVYEFIGEASGNASSTTVSFSDTNIASQANLTPKIERDVFNEVGKYPSTVTIVQQRQAFANTTYNPEEIELSQIGNYSNFTKSSPVQDDDAIKFRLSGRQANAVRHLLEIGGKLVVLTSSSEWTVSGDNNGVITPNAITPSQQGYDGAATVAPVIIGNTALYVQARGSLVRDLQYDFNSDGYQGRDLTIFCTDLFDGKQVVSFKYQKIPHSVAWVVMNDGTMLGLTYVREHDIWGWHRHNMGTDTIEDVCCVPEAEEDAVYLVVRRAVGAGHSRYVERLSTRRVTDIAVDAFFVDSGLTYDGRNAGSTTMMLTGGTAWNNTEILTCTASSATFAASNVDDEVVITGADGSPYYCTIIGYTSSTVVSVRADRLLPVDLRATATTAWALAVNTVTGLGHLEGRSVVALCDGSVNGAMTVSGGSVTLSAPAIIAHVGLPYTSRIETLDAENMQGETWADKKRKVHAVSVRVANSRGLWLGFGDGALYEHQDVQAENYDDPIPLFSGVITENVDTAWERSGKVVIEQRDPLPMSVLSIIPQTSVGGV